MSSAQFKVGDIVGVISDIPPSDLRRAEVSTCEIILIEWNGWIEVMFKSNKGSWQACWAKPEWLVPMEIYNSPLYQALL